MSRFTVLTLVLTTALGCGACATRTSPVSESVVIDGERCEVRLSALVQKTDAPRMTDWGSGSPALLGSREGKNARYFVFLADAPAPEVHDALHRLGARSRVVYERSEVAQHQGLRPDNAPADYMQGDPVQIFVEWSEENRTHRRAYEDFFLEKTTVGGNETLKPWTPHFVFHGSGVLNASKSGCIACTHDCPGGIIGNNQYPLVDPIPVLKADWSRLPPPGTRVTVVIRPVPSGGS